MTGGAILYYSTVAWLLCASAFLELVHRARELPWHD
jgi:hypothetical protein